MLQSSTHQSFFFADLVGFTALTEEHGDEAAADLALAFADAVSLLAAEHRAEIVKTLGDAVMIRCPDHCGAVRLALRILEELSGRDGFPAVRIGMHTGPAVERAGDWFGATVNLAARVAATATGGEALVTEDTWTAVGALSDVDLEQRGPRTFKNVAGEPRVYAVADRASRSEMLAAA
jgi:adenylate cyclase